jgi:hypothetical protein
MKSFVIVSEGVIVGEGIIFSNGYVCAVPTVSKFMKTPPRLFNSLSEFEQALEQEGNGAVISFQASLTPPPARKKIEE